MKIIFIGTPEFGAIVLNGLIENNLKPVLVITAPDKPAGRKQILTPPPVKTLAEKFGIPAEQPEKIGNIKSKIGNLDPDLIITAAYGQIIPKEILEIPKHGCLNIHPSLLPKYRGASPIQSAILNGDAKTGVTIMLMDEKMDHGPIISQQELEILPDFQFTDLHDKLAILGAGLLIDTIPKWLNKEVKQIPQEESKATYTKIIEKEDGRIDWEKAPEEIERKIRAFNPWPGTFTEYNGKRLKILEAEVSNNKLIIKKVQLEGKKAMSFDEFLMGHPDYVRPY